MSGRRLVGAWTVLAWLSLPAATLATSSAAHAHDSCRGHVCRCTKSGLPKRALSCHGAPEGAPSEHMASRCNHEPPAARVAARGDSLPCPREELRVLLESTPLQDHAALRPSVGHVRLDPQPPRS